MSIIKSEDSKKWINFVFAICSIIIVFVVIRFLQQLGEWFALEAKISNFLLYTNIIGVLSGVASFVFIIRNHTSMKFTNEVFSELVKVVWPDHDSVVKITIGILIGVSILSTLFVSVDAITRQLFSLIY